MEAGKPSVVVEQISLGMPRPNRVRAMVVQLAFSADDWQPISGLPMLRNPQAVSEHIASFLELAGEQLVDVVLFPELSVPPSVLPRAQRLSKQHAMIVIAGSHYYQHEGSYISRCPVIIHGDVYFTDKVTPSPHEVSPVAGQGLTEGHRQILFQDTPIGNFAVLVCADYLDAEVKSRAIGSKTDILAIPAFHRRSDDYHTRMSSDCQDSPEGLYCLYSNACQSGSADGSSALFGLMDRLFVRHLPANRLTDLNPPNKLAQLHEGNGYLMADLDLQHKRPALPHTVHSRPNVTEIVASGTPVASDTFGEAIGQRAPKYDAIDSYFVPPQEYEAMISTLEASHLLFIVGDPGIGKTYTALRILKHYHSKGYRPKWLSGLEEKDRQNQRQLLQDFEPQEKAVVYFEDPFGKMLFERRDSLVTCLKPLMDLLRHIDARIVVSSRGEIFSSFLDESPEPEDYRALAAEMSVVKPSYSTSALIDILRRLASEKCLWYANGQSRGIVENAIRTGYLSTPLGIHDLVMSTWPVSAVADIIDCLRRRQREAAVTFAHDLSSASPAAKLSLIIVLLTGSHRSVDREFIYRWVAERAADRFGLPGTSFRQELRAQVGHRIEVRGPSWHLAFAHPLYEEALARVAATDGVTAELAVQATRSLANLSYRLAWTSVASHVHAYPSMTYRLLESLVNWRDSPRTEDGWNPAGTLVHCYGATKDPRFAELLAHFDSREEIIIRINSASSVRPIPRLLRIAAVYERHVSKRDSSELASEIDWDHLVTLLRIHPERDRLAMTFLAIAVDIEENIVSRYLESLQAWRPASAVRFIRTLTHKQATWTIRHLRDESQKKLVRSLAATKQGNWRNTIRMLAPDLPHVAHVQIDDGAFAAIRSGGSVLPVGVIKVFGDFLPGDVVPILDGSGQVRALGMAEYSSTEMSMIKGLRSHVAHEILGGNRGCCFLKEYIAFC